MTNQNIFNPFVFILAITSLFAACKKDDPKPGDPPVNENELITTLILHMRDSTDNTERTFIFRDTDGEGGNGPTQFDTISLQPGKVYYTTVILLDESKTPADSISNEVLEEANEHLMVFSTGLAGLKIVSTDRDDNGLPVGLQSVWRTAAPGTGQVRVTLKHQPGIKNGSPDPGETDIEVDFPAVVK